MNSWPLLPLDEIADVSAGNPAPQDPTHFSDDGHPFVRMQDVGRVHVSPHLTETVDRITDAAVRQGGLKLYPEGTLLVPKSGASVNLNHRAMLGRAAYVVSHLATIIPDSRRVDPSYLFHWSMVYDPRKQAQVTSLPSLPLSLIKAALVPLPPLDEQRRIVGLLDRAAEIRRRADATRSKARAIIPALFLDTFGDPATNPKGWQVQSLNELADIGSGLTKGRKLNGTPTEPTPYLRVANVQADRLDLSEIKMIDATVDDRARCRLLPGDLLMTEGGDLDKLGRCAMWRGEIDLCLHQNHIFRVRMGHSVIPDYARAFMQCEAARGYFLRVAKRTTGIASINKTQLGHLPVWVPPLSLQNAFAEQASRLDSLARHLDTAAVKAEAMAAGLSAEVFGDSPNRGNGHG